MAGVTVIYKGDRITTFDNSGIKTLETAGKYCEDDIIINYNKNGNKIVEGNSSIVITDAEEGDICGLTQYGVCEQNASTNAISCNNGVLSISGGEIITTATNSETLTLGTQTATVENLYSVGNVRDTQEIVSGKIIHKNDICIYDGTQPVGDKYISSTGAKENGAIIIYPLETEYTGTNLASFTEANQGELNSLEVGITPIQDLHGYDNPWPAGGGVSKCPSLANGTHTMTNGPTVTIQDGEITINGTASGSGYYEEAIESTVMPADTYVSLNNPAATYNIAYVFLNGNTQLAAPSTAPANTTKHTTGLSGKTVNKLRVYCNAGTYDNFKMSPIVHDGSTPQAWQPYANICPITGRTGANVYRTGINIWDEVWEQGSIDNSTGQDKPASTGIRGKNYIPVVAGESYYICNLDADNYIRYYYYDSAYGFVSSSAVNNSVLTIPSGVSYMRIRSTGTYGNVYKNDWTVNYPATDTQYHAYQGTTYTVDWTSEAGTVYGGTVDVVTGVLTVDMTMVDLSTLTWGYNSEYAFFSAFISQGATYSTQTLWCSYYKYGGYNIQNSAMGSAPNATVWKRFTNGLGTNANAIYVKNSRYSDATAFKNSLIGVPLVYELATPVTYQLTPQEIKTLIGTNNVWSNDITSIKVAVSNFTIEQVTPQPLKLQEGNNTVNATNLSVSTVPLKLEYMVDLVDGDNLSYGNNTSNYVNAGAADYMII